MKHLFIALVVSLGLLSCSKDNDDNKTGAAGTWVGTWKYLGENQDYGYILHLKENGELVRYDENSDVIANGTWHVIGTNFTANYTMTTNGYHFTLAGSYNEAAGEMTGTFGETPSNSDGGTFTIHKQ